MPTPVEVDTQLAEIYGRLAKANAVLTRFLSRDFRGNVRGTTEQIHDASMKVDEVCEETKPLEAIFRAAPWTRVFVVPGGHAHSSMSCHTCYPTTMFSWMPEWSGKDEAEIIDAAGDRACTVCYPSAPVNKPTTLYTPTERKQIAEREAEAAARRAKREAAALKAIFYRGGELKGRWGVIKTERTAEIELVDWFWTAKWYRNGAFDPGDYEVKERIAEALSDKRGIPVSEVLAAAEAKADKKLHKDDPSRF